MDDMTGVTVFADGGIRRPWEWREGPGARASRERGKGSCKEGKENEVVQVEKVNGAGLAAVVLFVLVVVVYLCALLPALGASIGSDNPQTSATFRGNRA